MTDPGWAIPGVPHDAPPPASHRLGPDRSPSRSSSNTGSPGRPPAGGHHDAGGANAAAATAAHAPGAAPALEAADPAEALAFLRAGLEYLAHADAAEWPAGVQASCLRALAVAEAQQAAAHAQVLAAFSVPGGGLAGDGHRSPRTWLTWQTQATRRAATVHVARMRGLAEHPLIAAALAGGTLSLSWARQLMEWSDRLPEGRRADADERLLAGAVRGAGLSDLFGLFEELRRQCASADTDPGDGFADRGVQFATTFGGAGRIEGDLTARCAAAVEAVLGSLSAKRGPEDVRTLGQRQHDALEEACTRLLAADCLPERAGQPVRLELTITLDELTRNGGGSPAGPGIACDAAIQPLVTGIVDYDLLHRLASPDVRSEPGAEAWTQAAGDRTQAAADRGQLILQQAIAFLSGPAGAAALLRRTLGGPIAAISLPLDIAGTFDTIPVHLRRAVRHRDRHCRFPGCDMSAAACDVHHLTHRKDGGRHALANLALFCRFHHLVAIHRWGWHITLHPDGTTTARSPDGTKTLHSHSPPGQAA
jgi:Domain of unknown function (DUF222)